jgi:hypothetical protein
MCLGSGGTAAGLFRQQVAAPGEPCGAMSVGHEAEVPDAVEARWQDVKQKPAHELARIEGHDFGASLAAVVLPAEADLAVGHGDKSAVGDGDAMGVAPEIGQHLLGSPERALGVVSKTRLRHDDDPVDLPQSGAVGCKGVSFGERREFVNRH